MTQDYDIEIYANTERVEPFSEWLNSIRDAKTIKTLLRRIQRLWTGNFGDCKSFDGMCELRIDYGPGYRIYCARVGRRLILLLGGGDKSSQDKDIKKCKAYLEDHKRRIE